MHDMKNEMNEIKLPPEGLFLGTGVYPTDTDTLMCTMVGHYTWQTQYFGPLDMIDKIIDDEQGNLAQVWGYCRGFSPRLTAEWIYALDEIGIHIPAPDWDNLKNLAMEDYAEIFETYKERLGAGLLRFIREAKKKGLYTCFLYTKSDPQWVPEFSKAGGDHYLGYDFGERYNVGMDEARKILDEAGKLTLTALTDRLMGMVREHVDEMHRQGWGYVMATSGNFHLDYEILGGAEIPVVEDFAFPNLNFASALSRGLYRQHNLPMWGSHLAHEHYSWLPNSDPHRWDMLRAGLYMKYMAGSKMIINESGNWFVEHTLSTDSPKFMFPQTAREEFGIAGWGEVKQLLHKEPQKLKSYLEEARPYFPLVDYNSPVCRKYREIVADFWRYVKDNGTPNGQPEAVIGLAKGNNDLATARFHENYGISGLSDIAMTNPSWFQGAPERGWETIRSVFFPEVPVLGKYKNIHVSGTPYGQADIVSFARDRIDADFLLGNYKCLLFSGWNTCSDTQYGILCDYVKGGGTLFISLPHLSKCDDRSLDYKVSSLVNDGDFSELCGLRIKGRGNRLYWTLPKPDVHPRTGRILDTPMKDVLDIEFPRRFGILGVPLGNAEITDPEIQVLMIDDEEGRPVLTRHRLGKGCCWFLNTWSYPGAVHEDEGPGAVNGSDGLIGEIYRAIVKQCRGHVYITDDTIDPGDECRFISYSYFPEDGSICLYNVDFDHEHTVYVHHFGVYEKMTLHGGEFLRFHTSMCNPQH